MISFNDGQTIEMIKSETKKQIKIIDLDNLLGVLKDKIVYVMHIHEPYTNLCAKDPIEILSDIEKILLD